MEVYRYRGSSISKSRRWCFDERVSTGGSDIFPLRLELRAMHDAFGRILPRMRRGTGESALLHRALQSETGRDPVLLSM